MLMLTKRYISTYGSKSFRLRSFLCRSPQVLVALSSRLTYLPGIVPLIAGLAYLKDLKALAQNSHIVWNPRHSHLRDHLVEFIIIYDPKAHLAEVGFPFHHAAIEMSFPRWFKVLNPVPSLNPSPLLGVVWRIFKDNQDAILLQNTTR